MSPDWSVDFANEDQREKPRLIEEFEDLALLILKLQFGQDDMPFEDYMIMKGKDIIEVEYGMWELIDMALGHRIEPPSFDLHAMLLDSLVVDERPPLIMKLVDAQHHAQLLLNIF